MRRDVVVVGAGTAGMPAAIAAAEHGARVLVLEKEPRIGGMLHISGGQFSGAGTRRQRERGIVDTVEQHLEDVERLSHGLSVGPCIALGRMLGQRLAQRQPVGSANA